MEYKRIKIQNRHHCRSVLSEDFSCHVEGYVHGSISARLKLHAASKVEAGGTATQREETLLDHLIWLQVKQQSS